MSSEQKTGPTTPDKSGDPATSAETNAGAASAAPASEAAASEETTKVAAAETPKKVADPAARVFVKCVADSYKGMDPQTGEFLNLGAGDVHEISAAKFAQLQTDFPGDFAESTKAEFRKALAEKEDRAKKRNEARAKREALKADRDRKAATDDDDFADD